MEVPAGRLSTRLRARRGTVAGIAAIAAATAAFVLLRMSDPSLPPSGPVLNGVDLNDYFFPAASFLHSALRDGEWPLWNPYEFAGAPFLAAHATQAAYPPTLLLAMLPPHVLLSCSAVLHLFLLGMFTFAFARSAGLTSAGSLAMSLVYTFSFSTIGSVHNQAYLSTFAWGPAIFWGVQTVLNRPGPGAAAGLGVVVMMSLLGGYSQASLYTLQVVTAFACWGLLANRTARGAGSTFAWLAAGGLLGVAAAAVQLLPAAELASMGVRSIHGMSMDLADPLEWRFVHAEDFWNLFVGRARGIVHPPHLLALAAIVACIPAARRRLGWFFLVLLVAALDFARGRDGWLFPLYFQLPFGSIFRLPGRTIFLVDFAAAALVGVAISNTGRLVSNRRLAGLLGAFLATVAGIDAWQRNPLAYRFDPLVEPERLYERTRLTEFAREVAETQQRLFVQRSIIGQASRNFGTVHDVFVVPGYDPILPARYQAFFGIPSTVSWHGELSMIGLGRFSRPWPPPDPRLLDLLSVRYYVDALPSDLAHPAANPFLQRVVGTPPLSMEPPLIHPRPGSLPRAYLVHEIVPAQTDDEALARVRSLQFNARREAIVTAFAGRSPAPAIPGAAETAAITSYRRNSVDVGVHCASACLLVLTDLWYPGWQVTVDGREQQIFRANYLLRGVMVPEGSHDIRFRYAPRSFLLGAIVSAAALFAIAALGLTGAMRRRARA